jgi:hypothetical protein
MTDKLTAMPPERVDLLAALDQLRRNIPVCAQRAVLGTVSPADWIKLANILTDLGGLCRGQAVVEGNGTDDGSGRR